MARSIPRAAPKVEPPGLLVFTWTWEMPRPAMAGIETTIRIDLTTQGEGTTHLLMTHYGLPNDDERTNHHKGWTSVLTNIERLFEPGSMA